MNKNILLIISCLFLSLGALRAQDTTRVPPVDTTLVGRSILSVMGANVEINQTPQVRQALEQYTRGNAEKPITGYRIRVFYDNGQGARAKSESIERALKEQLGQKTPVYRSFESPNYKVTVGDFRSRDEALRIYNALKGTYPTAYIIKESINYPR